MLELPIHVPADVGDLVVGDTFHLAGGQYRVTKLRKKRNGTVLIRYYQLDTNLDCNFQLTLGNDVTLKITKNRLFK